jgi:hypothetical protein
VITTNNRKVTICEIVRVARTSVRLDSGFRISHINNLDTAAKTVIKHIGDHLLLISSDARIPTGNRAVNVANPIHTATEIRKSSDESVPTKMVPLVANATKMAGVSPRLQAPLLEGRIARAYTNCNAMPSSDTVVRTAKTPFRSLRTGEEICPSSRVKEPRLMRPAKEAAKTYAKGPSQVFPTEEIPRIATKRV